MKKFLKALAALAALALVSTSFIACSDDDDDDGVSTPSVYIPSDFASKTVVAKYAYRESGTTEEGIAFSSVDAYIFFSDNSWVSTFAANASKSEYSMKEPIGKGTYTGDPSKDGDVVITSTHYYDDEEKKWDDGNGSFGDSETITIANGKFDMEWDHNETATFVKE